MGDKESNIILLCLAYVMRQMTSRRFQIVFEHSLLH